jgi:hypothetical protein
MFTPMERTADLLRAARPMSKMEALGHYNI